MKERVGSEQKNVKKNNFPILMKSARICVPAGNLLFRVRFYFRHKKSFFTSPSIKGFSATVP